VTIRARFQISYERLDLFEHIGVQIVMDPASILPIADDAGVLENAKMERKTRLSRVERIGELANAPLSFAEQLDDLESGLVGEGVKKLDRALGS
jgi:hypothetical protein